jgi:DinB superfamily
MTELAQYRSQLIERYASQAGELAGLVKDMPDDAVHRELEPGGWSAHQVLTHVRDVEAQAFVPRVSRILKEDMPRLPGFDPEVWMDEHYNAQEPADDILREIEALRAKGSGLIQPLDPSGWSRTGEHPSFGTRTLQWWIEYAVNHFDEHLEQLARAGQS